MKDINHMNYFVTGIPTAMIGGGWLFQFDIFFAGLLLTMVTGAFHIIVGIGLLIESRFKSRTLIIYFTTVALFFTLWGLTDWYTILRVLPPVLALYMSIYIYIRAKQKTNL
jgi:hypothetical protein